MSRLSPGILPVSNQLSPVTILSMTRLAALTLLLSSLTLRAQSDKPAPLPTFDYDIASTHEIKPHRRSIPMEGIPSFGFNQLHLTLTISPTGDVTHAEARHDELSVNFWPKIIGEVSQWRFTPFEENGHPVAAQIEEYVDLVPPERLPKIHVTPPIIRPESKITIALTRSGCFGTCPAYNVTLSNGNILFEGDGYVVAEGKHTAPIDTDAVRKLARQFLADDFYSMDPTYQASITDCPPYSLSISIDGQVKEVTDYMGTMVGMPAVITDLEEQVDALARTEHWIKGSEGLVPALLAEKYNFQTAAAQAMLKQAAVNGQTSTVHELLEAGVPLKPMAAPKSKDEPMGNLLEGVGILTAAAGQPDSLKLLVAAGAGKNDQVDKDLALAAAANAGSLKSVKALIAYGANPNADLTKLTVTEYAGNITAQGPGAGSILIDAASSGNPEVVREILSYHPKLELRNREGQTAIFAAGEYRSTDKDGDRVECIRLLLKAGANVNARDSNSNTPLHEIFLDDVNEELLKHGANVNARNADGETPIFTNVSDDSVRLFIDHGADLNLRNNKGQTALEAAKSHGPQREALLLEAMQEANRP